MQQNMTLIRNQVKETPQTAENILTNADSSTISLVLVLFALIFFVLFSVFFCFLHFIYFSFHFHFTLNWLLLLLL